MFCDPKFIPHDKYAKILKAKRQIVPKPNTSEIERGVFSVKLSVNDTFFIYRRGVFVGVWVVGGYFAAIAGFENLEGCAGLAVERFSRKFVEKG